MNSIIKSMKAEDILTELRTLSEQEEIIKSEIMAILKRYARIISVNDLMLASARLRKDGEYIQPNYREKYLEIYIKYFLLRMNEVKEKNDYVDTAIDKSALDESFHLLERTFEKESEGDDDKFPLIYVITSLYTTFILEEPIHPVGSEFPGKMFVEERNGQFYCPVKGNQENNPNAICHLCLAEQTPDI